MKSVDLIIFDLDGTLVDSKKDIANSVNFALRHMGLKEKSVDKIASYIGGGVEQLIKKALNSSQSSLFKKTLSMFIDYYGRHHTDDSELYPRVKEILEYFKQKKKVIITNRKYEFAELTLKALGIRNYFENIIGGDNVGCIKPSSCPLDKTMTQFKTDKEKVIIIGDMHIDVIAGKNAGITTCAVTYGIGKKEDILKAHPDYIIDDIIELKEIIK